ncbi:MAG: multiheme c-type cytochrome [Stagnimonas sp.]|nr:multiheme c-type cytochrome [Stagnimonas sp.]
MLLAGLLGPALLPATAGDRHEGVASCAGGTCHGATRPLGDSGIRQDEYFIWQQRDPHSQASATLGSERSRRIGVRLGIQPQTAAQCLACHGDAAAPGQRGERWLASDGIGCETCHGGSGRWLAEHTQPGMALADKVALGMTPTWQPQARAALCQSCHQGDAEHPITHAMMAAGHPPLLFELDTFVALQPPHHDRDADYQQRKGAQDPARNWALGQALAADRLLHSLEDGRIGAGLFPELVLFDCDACHHPLNAERWQPGRNAGTAPGTPPLADAPFYWLGLWLEVAAPELAPRWQQGLAALQASTDAGRAALPAAARALRQQLRAQLLPRIEQQSLQPAQLKNLLRRLADLGSSVRANDFLIAEQAAMASQVLSDALAQQGQAGSEERRAAIDALFLSVRRREQFQPAAYHAALGQLQRSLR